MILKGPDVWLLVAAIWNESGGQKGVKMCTVTQETLLQTFSSSGEGYYESETNQEANKA